MSRTGGLMGCVYVGWVDGLCLERVGQWFVSRTGGSMVCV